MWATVAWIRLKAKDCQALHRKQIQLPSSRCFQHFASGYGMKTHRIMLQKWTLFLNQYTSVTEDYFKSIYIWYKGCRFPHLIWSVHSFCFNLLLSHFPNSHLMLPELEVCPCSYLRDPQLSSPLPFPAPLCSRQTAFPTHIPECQEHVLCSHCILLLHVQPTPPHLLLVMEKEQKRARANVQSSVQQQRCQSEQIPSFS